MSHQNNTCIASVPSGDERSSVFVYYTLHPLRGVTLLPEKTYEIVPGKIVYAEHDESLVPEGRF